MPTSITYVHSIASCWCFCMFCFKLNLCHARIVSSKWCGRLDLILSIHREHLLHHRSVWLKMSLDPAPTMGTSWPRLLCSYGLLFLSCFMVTLLSGNRHPKPRHDLHKRSRLNMKIGYLQSFHQFASVFNTASAPYISQCPPHVVPTPKKIQQKPSQKLNSGCWVACFWSLSILEQRVWYTVKLSCWSLVYFIHSSTPRPGDRPDTKTGGISSWSTSTWTRHPGSFNKYGQSQWGFYSKHHGDSFQIHIFYWSSWTSEVEMVFCDFSPVDTRRN